ncbi:hypothetical protein HA685_000197 [Listeria monocytogenes]|nr:hypothetical protein [Listeria monocytogenes]EHG1725384.1 hypothetical protein [Listeria monocytogenes]
MLQPFFLLNRSIENLAEEVLFLGLYEKMMEKLGILGVENRFVYIFLGYLTIERRKFYG